MNTATYQASFLEKLLGKQYKWWVTFWHEWSRSNAKGLADLIFQFQIFISSMLWIYIWSLASIQTVIYLTVGRVISFLTNNFYYNAIAHDIVTGRISNLLLTPNSIIKIYFFRSAGGRLHRNALSTITIVIVLLIFNAFIINIPFSSINFWVLIYLPILFLINYYLCCVIGSLGFFIKDKRDFSALAESVTSILNICTGLLIPLDKIPLIGSILVNSPLSLQFYHPTNLALGKYSTLEGMYVFLGGIVWCFTLYIFAKFLFKIGLKRYESVGL